MSELLFPATAAPAASAQPSEVECRVLSLFEQFRNPLFRYVISFGIPVHEAEEITQEVFHGCQDTAKSSNAESQWIYSSTVRGHP
jgi:DNA-directed RNA polymerase specialized sigma24 family protein